MLVFRDRTEHRPAALALLSQEFTAKARCAHRESKGRGDPLTSFGRAGETLPNPSLPRWFLVAEMLKRSPLDRSAPALSPGALRAEIRRVAPSPRQEWQSSGSARLRAGSIAFVHQERPRALAARWRSR